MKFSAMKPVVLTLILIAVSPLTSSCAGCGVEKIRDVPPPARGASPDQVVRTYLEALSAHDVDTMRAVSSAKYFERQEEAADGPLCNWTSLEEINVGTPHPDVYGLGGYRQVNQVLVDFVVKQREEMTMQNGWNAWGYILGRNSEHEPWLIVDAGIG